MLAFLVLALAFNTPGPESLPSWARPAAAPAPQAPTQNVFPPDPPGGCGNPQPGQTNPNCPPVPLGDDLPLALLALSGAALAGFSLRRRQAELS